MSKPEQTKLLAELDALQSAWMDVDDDFAALREIALLSELRILLPMTATKQHEYAQQQMRVSRTMLAEVQEQKAVAAASDET